MQSFEDTSHRDVGLLWDIMGLDGYRDAEWFVLQIDLGKSH